MRLSNEHACLAIMFHVSDPKSDISDNQIRRQLCLDDLFPIEIYLAFSIRLHFNGVVTMSLICIGNCTESDCTSWSTVSASLT